MKRTTLDDVRQARNEAIAGRITEAEFEGIRAAYQSVLSSGPKRKVSGFASQAGKRQAAERRGR